jgi:hypothetical protein
MCLMYVVGKYLYYRGGLWEVSVYRGGLWEVYVLPWRFMGSVLPQQFMGSVCITMAVYGECLY